MRMERVIKKLNPYIIGIMEKNNVCLNDTKHFKDVYNGYVIEYDMTFAELFDATDIVDAILYWNDIDPYSEENTLKKQLELGLIDGDEYIEYLEDYGDRL